MKTTALLGALLLFAFAQGSKASDITYNVTETVGAGSVSGSITTDGTLGTLGTGNIVDWNLTINDGTGGPFDLTSGDSQELVQGGDLTANPTQLIFNFNGTDGGFFAIEAATIGDGGPFIGYGSLSGGFDSTQSINISSEDGETTIVQPTFTGNQVIAGPGTGTIVGGSPVPEPSSMSLLLLGLVGVFFAANSRSRRLLASLIG